MLTRLDLVRLVAEANAAADDSVRQSMATSMDIEPARLAELFATNEREWEILKGVSGLIRATRGSDLFMPGSTTVSQTRRQWVTDKFTLSPHGFLAWRTICQAFAKVSEAPLDRFYTGGCRAFYSPLEWRAKGERYGCDSELIVVYDGGDVRMAFDSHDEWACEKSMRDALSAVGLYAERCTHWYSAIYVANQELADSLSIPVPEAP